MRSFLLSKFIIPLHIAFTAAYLAWVQPGPGDVAAYLPLAFLSFGLLQFMLLFPAARRGEDVDFARARVLSDIGTDPFLVSGILGIAFVVLQTLNGPRQLVYVRAVRAWEYTSGIIAGFPACLDQLLSIQTLFTVVVVTLAVLAVRNSLGRNGRGLLVRLMVAVATVLGLHGLLAYAQTPFFDEVGNILPPPASFATFASKSEAGAFFLMNSCAAFGALFMELVTERDEDDKSNKWAVRFLFAAFLVNVVSTLFTLSCLSMAVLVVALLILATYAFASVLSSSAPGELSLSTLAAIVVIGGVAVFLHFVAYPENRLHDCAERIFKGPWRERAETAERAALVSAAWRMFDDNKIGGVGASCYGIQAGFPKYVERSEWKDIGDPDGNHFRCGNDLAQILAENGLVGTLIFLAPFVILAIRAAVQVFMVMRYGTKFKQGRRSTTASDGDRVDIFDALPPDVLALFIAVLSVTAMSFFVPVFESQPNILYWAVFLAVACSQLPKPGRTHSRKR